MPNNLKINLKKSVITLAKINRNENKEQCN